jgi:glycosidase
MSVSDLLQRRKNGFTLWLPQETANPPALVIGQFVAGAPPSVALLPGSPLVMAQTAPGLWELPAGQCGLVDGEVYHYWFEIDDAAPWHYRKRVRRTDPLATTTDWRVMSSAPAGSDDDVPEPAGVIKFQNGQLLACDPGGSNFAIEANGVGLAANNFLIIYELPPRWSQEDGSRLTGVGTFRDVQALVDSTPAANFAGVRLLDQNQYLVDLGVTAIELLPIADSYDDREWGYGTSNYAAPDFDLGFPKGYSYPTANQDFASLVNACHKNGIRMFLDVVLGYGRQDPDVSVGDSVFHFPQAASGTSWDNADPEQRTSRPGVLRQDWGGRLWRYITPQSGVYDPISGTIPTTSQPTSVVPARHFLRVAVERWIRDFHVDGLRLDSVETIANWDFVGEYRQHARSTFAEVCASSDNANDHFLVVGEELTVPLALLKKTADGQPGQDRLDSLWNETFKKRIRAAILGHNFDGDGTFEDTIRRLVDCRAAGFSDGSEAVNYITSHDVEGDGNQRLFDYLDKYGVGKKEERFKLAFTCLLTAVGIPMILAGEEFGDQSDLSMSYPQKEFDAVNWDRLQNAIDQAANGVATGQEDTTWRMRVRDHVRALCRLRASHPALGLNDTNVFHLDFDAGKRVMAWSRGSLSNPVVVVANFSDWGTDPSQPGAEYRVPNWPATPLGMTWFEVTTNRMVPPDWIGRWGLFPWDAKVYIVK